MKTKIITLIAIIATSLCCFAKHNNHHRSPTPPVHYKVHHAPHHKHHDRFWPGFGVGTLIGASLVAPALPSVFFPRKVWVPPVYEMRPVRDVFGNIIRYESIMVRPGYWR